MEQQEFTIDHLIDTRETSKMLGVPEATLRYWRHIGTGPKSFTLGKKLVKYRRSDVLAWLEEQYNAAETVA